MENIKFADNSNLVVEKKQHFFNWIKKTYGSIEEFMKLKPHNKEKLFLKWKWGFENHNVNEDLEMTRKSIISMTSEIDYVDERWKYYFNNIRFFEKQCKDVRSRIGLEYAPKENKITQEISELAKTFNGYAEENNLDDNRYG